MSQAADDTQPASELPSDATAAPAKKTLRAKKPVAVSSESEVSSAAPLDVGAAPKKPRAKKAVAPDDAPGEESLAASAPTKAPRKRKLPAEAAPEAAADLAPEPAAAALAQNSSEAQAEMESGATAHPQDDAQSPQSAPAGQEETAERDGRRRRERPRRQGGEQRARAPAAERPPRPDAKAVDTSELLSSVVSGTFDEIAEPPETPTAESSATAEETKRVLEPGEDAPKLHKVLAQMGVASRRDIEQWIADGKITVNGEAAHTGQRVQITDVVEIAGKPVRLRFRQQQTQVLLYHKPTGEVCSSRDPQGRPSVFDRLPQLRFSRWVSVGRLDINTEGLLVFTTNGELANRLMHPRYGIEREYAVRVLGELSDESREQLLKGVMLDDGMASFKRLEVAGGESANRWYRVVIDEGRNREVRRMFEAVGHAVSRLIRVRYAHLPLPHLIKRGQFAELDMHGVEELMGRVDLQFARKHDENQQQQHDQNRRDNRRKSADRGGTRERDQHVAHQAHHQQRAQQAVDVLRDGDEEYMDHEPGDVNGNTMSNNGYGSSREGFSQLGLDGQRSRRNRGGGGGGSPGRGAGGQPDPMRTTFGYVQHGAGGGANRSGGGGGGGGQRRGGGGRGRR